MDWRKRFQPKRRFFILLLFGWMVLLTGCHNHPTVFLLVVRDQQDPEQIYWTGPVRPGDDIHISWTHSVEKSTWIDTLTVTEDGELYLDETRFRSFGAGMPYTTEGTVTFQDGYIIMKNLRQPMPTYRWVHSHRVGHQIRLNQEVIVQPDDIPHHRMVELLLQPNERPFLSPSIRSVTEPDSSPSARLQSRP